MKKLLTKKEKTLLNKISFILERAFPDNFGNLAYVRKNIKSWVPGWKDDNIDIFDGIKLWWQENSSDDRENLIKTLSEFLSEEDILWKNIIYLDASEDRDCYFYLDKSVLENNIKMTYKEIELLFELR